MQIEQQETIYSEEQQRLARKLWNERFTVEAIANQLNKSKRSTSYLIHQILKLPSRKIRRPWSNEDEILLEQLLSQEYTVHEISQILNRTPASIHLKTFELGLTSKQIPWDDPEELTLLKELRSIGLPYSEIYEELNKRFPKRRSLVSIKRKVENEGWRVATIWDVVKNDFIECLEQNLTFAQIANLLEVHPYNISKWNRKLRTCIENNMSIQEIADEFEFSGEEVRIWFERLYGEQ